MNRAPSSRLASSLEILETRIAPAAVFTYTDADGQAVTITSSKGTLADLEAALGPLPADATTPTQILTLTLGAVFKGANISIVAGASDADGVVTKIGFIDATGVDLGKVTVDGELNRIAAGDGNSRSAGLRGLTVNTFGKFDVTPESTVDGEFDSRIVGALNSLTVHGDMSGAYLRVIGSDSDTAAEPLTDRDGKIGNVKIGGSLIGTARDFGGAIVATGNLGNLTVGGDVKGVTAAGMAVPAGQDQNAFVSAGGSIGAISITGNLVGGDGDFSGHITSGLGIRSFSVTNLFGGFGEESGVLGSSGALGKVMVAESVIGGDGFRAGSILSAANMKAVTVGGDLIGGNGESSGWIASSGTLASVTVGRDIIGGGGQYSGAVGSVGKFGAVEIAGDLVGGTGASSGQVVSQSTIAKVTIGGDLVGGTNFETGAIGSLQGLGPILIKGSIFAGSGERSALITTQKASYDEGEAFIAAPIASVTVLGSIDSGDGGVVVIDVDGGAQAAVGGPAGFNSAGILASGNLGAVVIKGSVTGGDGESSGRISSTHNIKSVLIEGSLIGGRGGSSGAITASGTLGPVSIGTGPNFGNLEGGDGDFSGVIFSATKIAKVTIGGNIFGGDGFVSGVIEASTESSSGADIGAVVVGGSIFGGDGNFGSGAIFSSGKIASVTIGDPKYSRGDETENIGGNLVGGYAQGSGAISADGDLGPVKVHGSVFGGAGTNSGGIFSGGKISSLYVADSIVGGSGDHFDSSSESERGQVSAMRDIAKVDIGGSLVGGSGNGTAQIRGQSVGTVTVHDSIRGGDGAGSGSILSYEFDIKKVVIGGGLEAGDGERSGWVAAQRTLNTFEAEYITGFGAARAKVQAGERVGTVTVNSIAFSSIFAGLDIFGNPFNADAQIGTVRVESQPGSEGSTGGYIISVNIVAGAYTGQGGPNGQGDGVYGTPDDVPLSTVFPVTDDPRVFSKIAKVIIEGDVFEAPDGPGIPVRYGIIAQHLGSIVVGGVAKSLTAGAINDPITFSSLVGSASDTTYGEPGLTVVSPIVQSLTAIANAQGVDFDNDGDGDAINPVPPPGSVIVDRGSMETRALHEFDLAALGGVPFVQSAFLTYNIQPGPGAANLQFFFVPANGVLELNDYDSAGTPFAQVPVSGTAPINPTFNVTNLVNNTLASGQNFLTFREQFLSQARAQVAAVELRVTFFPDAAAAAAG